MDDHEPLPPDLEELFEDGAAERSLRVPLPAGSTIWPDPGYPQYRPPKRPAFWVSDEPVGGSLWARMRAEHAASGLWPLLLEDSTQPWSAGQIAPEPVAEIDNYEPAAFMAEVWADLAESAVDLAPFDRYSPGPAPPGEALADPDAVADRWAARLSGRPLGLAAVRRGSDALVAMGWQGARHHNPWTAPLAAVVRSWEDRFGARVVGIGFNTLDLSVAAPPVTMTHALHVAAEHWTFCPEIIVQGPGTLTGHAEAIIGNDSWAFFWE